MRRSRQRLYAQHLPGEGAPGPRSLVKRTLDRLIARNGRRDFVIIDLRVLVSALPCLGQCAARKSDGVDADFKQITVGEVGGIDFQHERAVVGVGRQRRLGADRQSRRGAAIGKSPGHRYAP